MACQDYHLCARLKAGINGAIHGVQALWCDNLSTEEWGFLLVDAKNAFNKINRFRMLCMVQHLLQSGARSIFNFYRRWSSLVLRNWNGTASILHSREGVTHGGTLVIITYGIGILPLINNLVREIPAVTQP